MTSTPDAARRNIDLQSALEDARARFAAANPKSKQQHEKACASLPGGNTRTVLHYDPFPLTITKGRDATLWDADGHQYTDMLGEYSAGLYGHSNPKIQAAVKRILDDGILLCGPNEYEAELASLVCDRYPSCDRVRFCNSGTEANLMAVTAARAHTGRSHVMVYNGGYHGGVFYFAHGNSPVNAPYPFVIAEYNDLEQSLALIEQHAGELAAVLIEPLQATAGAIPAEREFLDGLRQATAEHDIVLIFDEVMTSRLSPGGLQQRLDVVPDVTSFGKYMGGGLTFGAFGGRKDIMDQFDPRGANPLPHAGTFNNNVLTMAAGVVGLRDVYTPEVAERHNARGDRFRDELNATMERLGLPAQVTGTGTLLGLHLQREPIHRSGDTAVVDPAARALLHIEMLLAGYYQGRSGLMAPALPLTDEDYSGFGEAVAEFLTTAAPLLEH